MNRYQRQELGETEKRRLVLSDNKDESQTLDDDTRDRKPIDQFPEVKVRTDRVIDMFLIAFCEQSSRMTIYFISSCHVESVVKLTRAGL